MSGLTNDFAFSFSGWKTFRTCPRKWWLSKVRFWEGWEPGGKDPDAKLAYSLTKMQTYFSLAGSIVHALAQDFVRSPRQRGPGELAEEFAQRFEDAEKHSVIGGWSIHPKKHPNIFERYYRHPDLERIRLLAHAAGVRALQHLVDSPAVARARRGKVLQAEVLERFAVAGVPVWVQIDLVTEADGRVWLEDHKTGKRRPEHRAQALLYALYAHDDRGVELERLRVALGYLRDGSEDVLCPTAEELDEIRAGILESAGLIMERLQPSANGGPLLNLGREEDFPGVDDPAVCADCAMFHACKGTRRIPWPGARQAAAGAA